MHSFSVIMPTRTVRPHTDEEYSAALNTLKKFVNIPNFTGDASGADTEHSAVVLYIAELQLYVSLIDQENEELKTALRIARHEIDGFRQSTQSFFHNIRLDVAALSTKLFSNSSIETENGVYEKMQKEFEVRRDSYRKTNERLQQEVECLKAELVRRDDLSVLIANLQVNERTPIGHGNSKEMQDYVANLQTQIATLKSREAAAYDQMKASARLVDEYEVKMSGAMVEKQQMEEQLRAVTQRFDEYIATYHDRIQQECTSAVTIERHTISRLEKALKSVTEEKASLEVKLQVISERADRSHWQNTNIAAAAQPSHTELLQLKADMNRLRIEHEELQLERQRLKEKWEMERRSAEKELQGLHSIERKLQERLHTAELELQTVQRTNLHLVTEKSALEQQLLDNKNQLCGLQMEADRQKSIAYKTVGSLQAELDRTHGLLSSHSRLIRAFREETHRLVGQLKRYQQVYDEQLVALNEADLHFE